MTIARSERAHEFTAKDSAFLGVYPANLPWLKRISQAFEMWRLNSIKIEWRPSVGTGSAGTAALGCDWGSSESSASVTKPTRDMVLRCTPCIDTPVWRPATLTVPSSMLRARMQPWYDTGVAKGPLTIQADVSAGGGEVWVHYSVTFSGTC